MPSEPRPAAASPPTPVEGPPPLPPPESPGVPGRLERGRWTSLVHLTATTSTNDVVAARARAGEPAGLVVVADRQTAGRGRLARPWEDRAGGSLLVSCLVDTSPQPPDLTPLAAGLAVADAVRAAGSAPELKWPNDVLVAGRKCAGILVEAVRRGDEVRLVIGVGVNVDWAGASPPAGGTTLAEATGRPVDRWQVLADLLAALHRRLGELEREPGQVPRDYAAACTTLGRRVRVTLPASEVVVGEATRLDQQGALVVAVEGAEVTVRAGDVEHLRPE